MEKTILSAYTKPGHPTFYAGLNQVLVHWKPVYPELTLKTVKGLLAQNEGYTRHKQSKRGKTNPIFCYFKRDTFSIDLVDCQNISQENAKTRFLLNVIDNFTKYAWSEPLKNKTQDVVLEAFKKIVKNAKTKPRSVFADSGSEFKNAKFKKFCRDNSINLYFAQSFGHASMIERFNLTLKRKQHAFMTDNETYRFVPHLKKILMSYNTSIHSALPNITPLQAENGDEETFYQIRLMNEKKYSNTKRVKPQFEIGDKVRISTAKNKFSRGFKPQYQDEVFKVSSVNDRLPKPRYEVDSYNNEETIVGRFMPNELQSVDKNIFVIDKILDRRKSHGVKQIKVKWRNYDKPEWINENQIVRNYKNAS